METAVEELNLNISQNNLGDYFLDFEKMVFQEEQILSQMMDMKVHSIIDYLSEINDKEIIRLFEENIIIYKINQIDKNGNLSLTIKEDTSTFIY